MYFAIGVEPTNEIAFTVGMREQRVDRFLVAVHDVEHAVGQPRFLAGARAMRIDSVGSRSDGFSTNVLPHAIATGNIHSGTIAGKLNGVMPAHTPTGCRSEKLSTSVPTFSLNSPFRRCGMPVANSITSMPRVTSPSASASVLPCSCVMIFARSLRCASMSSRKRIRMRARRSDGYARQAGSAAAAAAHRGVDVGGIGRAARGGSLRRSPDW